MIRKLVVVSLVAYSILVSSIYAQGQHQMQKNSSAIQKKHSHGHDSKDKKMHLVKKIVDAVSKTGLSTSQAKEITSAINDFKSAKKELKALKMFPIDAVQNDKFDSKMFVEAKRKMFDKKMELVTELFESVYDVLTDEQKKVFKREFSAPIIKKMIKKGMHKHHSKKH
jgi:hypothetical protein